MMNPLESRQNEIINFLKINQFASIHELKELVNYSEATIKRDLVDLENDGLIRRTRGGAMIIDNEKIDVPYLMKIAQLDEDKNKKYVAELAEGLIKDDMILFIDSSTTCLHLVNLLAKFDGLRIITNGLLTAVMLSEFTNAQISVLGGSIVPKRATINGSKAFADVLNYNVDIAFVSCRGFSLDYGATETSEGEALIKKAFRKQAQKVAVLVTHDKFDSKYMYQSMDLSEIDYLISDKEIPDLYPKKIETIY
ncbi:DeoR/GlpR family DNA-binding transcription regulator [Enterococcus sp. AZ103]|uniref:DeoR/GlpR family DNA-binding transcription regulator n=1 Tax=Enterococcus sp. AZ103 TaxID=2774628 RepID=UPI003F23F0A6